MPPKTKKKTGVRAGLTREESKDLTRRRLMRAAEEEFGVHGLEGANIRDILERAGVSPGAFYHSFEDKNDLFLALVEEATRELHQLMHESRATQTGDGPVAWVESQFEQLLEYGRHRKHLVAILYREALSGNKKVAAFFERDHAAYIADVEADFRLMIEKRLLPPIDPRWAAYMVVNLGYQVLVQQLRNPENDAEWVRAIAKFILGGLPFMSDIAQTKQA